MNSASKGLVIQHLWHCARRREGQFLGAVVDAARAPDIHRTIHAAASDSWCLLRGDVALDVAEAAPYLVLFERGAPLLETLVDRGWDDAWGLFFTATGAFDPLLERLQSNLTARLPTGETVIFRFYDPRVLRVYLPTCTTAELGLFFGPVTSWVAPDADGRIVEFRRSQRAPLLARPWSAAAASDAALPRRLPSAMVVYPSGLSRKCCEVVGT